MFFYEVDKMPRGSVVGIGDEAVDLNLIDRV